MPNAAQAAWDHAAADPDRIALRGAGEPWTYGRKKDLIIRGGCNVYPREVEEVLYEHPDM